MHKNCLINSWVNVKFTQEYKLKVTVNYSGFLKAGKHVVVLSGSKIAPNRFSSLEERRVWGWVAYREDRPYARVMQIARCTKNALCTVNGCSNTRVEAVDTWFFMGPRFHPQAQPFSLCFSCISRLASGFYWTRLHYSFWVFQLKMEKVENTIKWRGKCSLFTARAYI